MRFLWQSNAPWAGTGYGAQTRLLLRTLQSRGHIPNAFCFWGLQGGQVEYDGYTCWPASPYETWGNDVIKAHIKNSKAEALITLIDLFVLDEKVWSELPVPWIAWTPIDCEDIGWPTLERLKLVDHPVAMSEFGADEMLKAGIEPLAMIPHAVDGSVFHPRDKFECRKELGVTEDCYLVGMVMANKGDRKQYPLQLMAVKEWMDKRPEENIKLLIHTDTTDSMGGWDFKSLVKKLGLSGQVHTTDPYFSSIVPVGDETMAKMYSAMDVLLNVSAGEGFGIPIIEAQACGTPVIAHNVTAMTENVGYGALVNPKGKFLAHHYGFQFHPDMEDLVSKLETVYRTSYDAVELHEWAIDRFNLEQVTQAWDEVLTHVTNASGSYETVGSPSLGQPIPEITDEMLERVTDDRRRETATEVVPS